MGQQVKINSKVNSFEAAEVEKIYWKLLFLDPKPSDLTMNKLKEFEDNSGRLNSSLWQ